MCVHVQNLPQSLARKKVRTRLQLKWGLVLDLLIWNPLPSGCSLAWEETLVTFSCTWESEGVKGYVLTAVGHCKPSSPLNPQIIFVVVGIRARLGC